MILINQNFLSQQTDATFSSEPKNKSKRLSSRTSSDAVSCTELERWKFGNVSSAEILQDCIIKYIKNKQTCFCQMLLRQQLTQIYADSAFIGHRKLKQNRANPERTIRGTRFRSEERNPCCHHTCSLCISQNPILIRSHWWACCSCYWCSMYRESQTTRCERIGLLIRFTDPAMLTRSGLISSTFNQWHFLSMLIRTANQLYWILVWLVWVMTSQWPLTSSSLTPLICHQQQPTSVQLEASFHSHSILYVNHLLRIKLKHLGQQDPTEVLAHICGI